MPHMIEVNATSKITVPNTQLIPLAGCQDQYYLPYEEAKELAFSRSLEQVAVGYAHLLERDDDVAIQIIDEAILRGADILIKELTGDRTATVRIPVS